MAIQDIQYIINIRSNVNGAQILLNGEGIGITNNTIPISIFELQQLPNQRLAITVERDNYISPIRYELFLTTNPNFVNVGGITSVSTSTKVVGIGDSADVVFENRHDANQQNFDSNITYSKITPLVIGVNKFENNNQVAFNQNFEQLLIELDFNLSPTVSQRPDTTSDNNSTIDMETIRLSINGKADGVKLILNDESEIGITKDSDVYSIGIGDELTISSQNLERFRITQIIVRGIDVNSIEIAENELESLSKTFTVTRPLVVTVDVEEIFVRNVVLPQISLINPNEDRKYNINTGSPYPIGIRKIGKVDSVRAVIGNDVIEYINLGDGDKSVIIIPETKFDRIGIYKINIIPRNQDGDGTPIEISVTVIDEVWVGEPDIKNIQYPSVIQGADYVGTNVDFEVSWESVNTDWVKVSRYGSNSFIKGPSTGKITLNIQNLLELDGLSFSQNENEIDITLTLTPYNESGKEVLKGKEEILQIKFSKGLLTIPRSVAINRILDGFISQLDTDILSIDASKYLTHTLHLGDGDNKVITTWTGSVSSNNEKSLILKLYEPLPTSVQPNDQVWISKYQSNPVIEIVTISGLDEDYCSPLKGPNFTLEPDNGIGFKVYDELIASGSETSTNLVNKYLANIGIDTSILNIQYTKNDVYLFENFINFGSAEERVHNFLYKVKLIEEYKTQLNNLIGELNENIILTNEFEILLNTGTNIISFDIDKFVFRNPTEGIEAGKVFKLLNDLLRSLDGFETFLFKSTTPTDLVYPKFEQLNFQSAYSIFIPKNTTDSTVINWYNFLVSKARDFDTNNPNYINNNIPEFIYKDINNKDFLLFFDMIGNHFDNIWVYITALSSMRSVDEVGIKGVPKEFISDILKSLGWSPKRSFDSQFLWEYTLGQNLDGSQKYSISLADANNQVWRRILNNLPYLLKHKGTGRALKAIMATYGVPQSMLTIMEFGGPQDPTKGGISEFTFDDRTSSLRLQSGSSVIIPWKDVPTTLVRPHSIEFMVKPAGVDTTQLLKLDDVSLSVIKENERFAFLELDVDGTILTTPSFSLSIEDYSNIVINKIDIDATDAEYVIYFKTSNGNKIIQSVSSSIIAPKSNWEVGSELIIGNDFNGNLDEVRLWRVPLEESKIDIHTLFPDSIAGNTFTSSTADLMFRLDFERPKNRILDPYIKNVAISQTYGELFATASNFYVAEEYPFQYTPYERTVTARVPSLGFNYSNKIRFEEQELIGDLSYKKRATKKSFDKSPIDSNKLGLFFSPIKELNMDIIKVFGDFNIDDYIGNPSDEYNFEYKKLTKLREYYFQRLDLNISEYIHLVKYINKSLFDVLTDLVPVRAKVSTGLLIEPHFLERNKVKWYRPSGSISNLEGGIIVDVDEKIEADYKSLIGIVGVLNDISDNNGIQLNINTPTFNGIIEIDDETELTAESFIINGDIQYSTNELIDGSIPTFNTSTMYELNYKLLTEFDAFGNSTIIGMDNNSMSNIGFGIYAPNSVANWKRFDINGNFIQSKENVFLIESEVFKSVKTQISGFPIPDSQPGDLVEFDLVATPFKNYIVTLLPFPNTINQSGNITNIKPLDGYFPTHYKFVNNLFEGLRRSFFKGSVQTANTTPDGLPVVEIFTTNPNILRVANTGRGSGQPILTVG
jgi:hypothetical protein